MHAKTIFVKYTFISVGLSFIPTTKAVCNVDIINNLTDDAFSASSTKHSASKIKTSKSGYWSPEVNDTKSFVQVNQIF